MINSLSSFFRPLSGIFNRTARRTFGASAVSESNVTQGTDWNGVYRDRYNYQRQTVLDEALLAWRLNPMARRIINLQKQYVIDGIEFVCTDQGVTDFLSDFWNHPLNKIGEHLGQWSDELALTGNLFLAITTDRAGMSYVRVFPTDLISDIVTTPNDIQQELAYIPKATADNEDPASVPSYQAKGKAKTVILHYAVNRLAGMKWGEPDIAPLLPWLARYASWLEDRVRLNRFRQAFLYVVTGKFNSEVDRVARQKQLNATPPAPGSILVADESETWDVINPKLDAFDANTDGLAVKKFIAGGMGYPLHWLAEPESSTRTTAEAAGTPTFKSLEERQKFFLTMLKDVLTVVCARAGREKAEIVTRASDISEKDNAALALATTQIVGSFGQLWANGFITEEEYLRVVYRFAGEVVPSDRPDAPAHVAPKTKGTATGASGIKVDTATGEVKTKEPQ